MKPIKIFVLFLYLSCFGLAHADVIAVVSIKSKVPTNIDVKDLKNLYLGRTNLLNGQKVDVCILNDGDAHRRFLSKYVNRTQNQFIRIWRKLVFTGKAKMPRQFKNTEELLEAMSENESLIGYLEESQVTKNIKVLKVKVK